jgi:hypothetical protein
MADRAAILEQGVCSRAMIPNSAPVGFYQPEYLGTISQAGKTVCFGWCLDRNYDLIALSIQGASTAVRAVQALILKGSSVTLTIGDSRYNDRSGRTAGQTYQFFVRAIPDSSYVSLIALNTLLFDSPADTVKFFLIDSGSMEDLLDRFYLRLKAIITTPIERNWCDWLFSKGRSGNRLCEPLLSKPGMYMTTRGFVCWWIAADRVQWEQLISDGLRDGHLSIDLKGVLSSPD